MNLGYMLNYCSKLLKHQLNKELKPNNITVAQFAVLKDIEMNAFKDGQELEVTAAEIAERLDMDKATASGIINRLIDKQYIQKNPNPKDKRSFILKLTKKAQEKLPHLEETNDLVLFEATQGLTNAEIRKFEDMMVKIIENIG